MFASPPSRLVSALDCCRAIFLKSHRVSVRLMPHDNDTGGFFFAKLKLDASGAPEIHRAVFPRPSTKVGDKAVVDPAVQADFQPLSETASRKLQSEFQLTDSFFDTFALMRRSEVGSKSVFVVPVALASLVARLRQNYRSRLTVSYIGQKGFEEIAPSRATAYGFSHRLHMVCGRSCMCDIAG